MDMWSPWGGMHGVPTGADAAGEGFVCLLVGKCDTGKRKIK